jgi:hypothetical protein
MKNLLLAVFLFLAVPAFAQLPDAPRANFTGDTRETATPLRVRIKAEREPRVMDKQYWGMVAFVGFAAAPPPPPFARNERHDFLDCAVRNGKCHEVGGDGYVFMSIARVVVSLGVAAPWMKSLKNDAMMENNGRSGWKWTIPGWIIGGLDIGLNAARNHQCKQGTVRLPNGRCP